MDVPPGYVEARAEEFGKFLELHNQGFTYKEIANLLNRDPKTIDNAIQRIKIKVKNYLDNKR